MSRCCRPAADDRAAPSPQGRRDADWARPPIWPDLGACWEHEITLEQTLPRERGQDYPVCVAYEGDSPVEYPGEDAPDEPEPFHLAEVNRKLAALGRGEGVKVAPRVMNHGGGELARL
jgi:Plasmid pRiA4b ORF-3-like protein